MNRSDADSSRAPFDYSGTELDALSQARNYYAWVVRIFKPYLGASVVEVGAGIGTFSKVLLDVPWVSQLTAIEPGRNTYRRLAERFETDSRVRVLHGYLRDYSPNLTADSIVAVNVLEHIRDDNEFLREAGESVAPGGTLLLYVPAIPAIFGSLDRAFEHHRRYTRPLLLERLRAANWNPVRVSYMNFAGIAAWWIAGRLLGKSRIAAHEARLYDRLVIPWTARLESLIEPPIGQNLIAIARKPVR